jgi:hypothetical protein
MRVAVSMTVPVELCPSDGRGRDEARRVFRLSRSVAVDRVELAGGLPAEPEWLERTLSISFHLPGDAQPIACRARAVEVVVAADTEEERAERRALDLVALPPEAATRIERYVEERLGRP